MQCPICAAEAIEVTSAGYDGVIVECKHCGTFDVTSLAINDLVRLDFDGRRHALQNAMASAPKGTRPAITPDSL